MKYPESGSKYISIFFVLTFYVLLSTKAYAFTSEGDNYILHMNVNTDPDDSNQAYNKPGSFIIKRNSSPTPTLIQSENPIAYESPTPTPVPIIKPPKTTIEIGYANQQPTSDFRFSLSDTAINFGPISPTDFITRQLGITVNGDPSYFYTISAYEDHELLSEKNRIIPNTTCDDGNCTDQLAGMWSDTLTFGFGYHCSNIAGTDCDSNFNDKDMYKKFSVGGNNENGETIVKGNTTEEKKVNIVYKINVPGSQAPGNYQNTITYLAVPMY